MQKLSHENRFLPTFTRKTMDAEATIDLQQTIALVLTPAPHTAISNVKWFQTNPIGEITPGTTPEVATFKPTTPGTTGIYATCDVAIV